MKLDMRFPPVSQFLFERPSSFRTDDDQPALLFAATAEQKLGVCSIRDSARAQAQITCSASLTIIGGGTSHGQFRRASAIKGPTIRNCTSVNPVSNRT